MKITHQLSVQLSKKLFIANSGLVLHLLENTLVSEAMAAKLKPLLIYSINIEGVPGRFVYFSAIDAPLPILDFLELAWNENNKEGVPEVLKVSKDFNEQFPWLSNFIYQFGIELIIADGKDRSFTANQRAAHGVAEEYHYFNSPRDFDHNIRSIPNIEEMNKPIPFQDGWKFPFSGSISSMDDLAISDYKKLNKNFIKITNPFEQIYEEFPKNHDWLLKQQKGIPTRPVDIIENDIKRSLGIISYEEFIDNELDDENNILYGSDLVRKLMKCWPQSLSFVAKRIGVKTKDFEWYLTGKKGLDETSFYRLCEYIQMRESHEFYYEDGSPFYELSGNYLLHARDKLAHIDSIFDELTGGGDYSYKVEVQPDNGKPDPNFRILLFGSYLDFHIIVFNRSSPAVTFINEKTNSSNEKESVVISIKMYSKVLRLFGDASNGNCNPANIEVSMLDLFKEIQIIVD